MWELIIQEAPKYFSFPFLTPTNTHLAPSWIFTLISSSIDVVACNFSRARMWATHKAAIGSCLQNVSKYYSHRNSSIAISCVKGLACYSVGSQEARLSHYCSIKVKVLTIWRKKNIQRIYHSIFLLLFSTKNGPGVLLLHYIVTL